MSSARVQEEVGADLCKPWQLGAKKWRRQYFHSHCQVQYLLHLHYVTLRGNCTPNLKKWYVHKNTLLLFSPIFLIFLVFFLNLVLWLGGSPTREGPGYATDNPLVSSGKSIIRGNGDVSLTPIQNDACTLCHACSSLTSTNTMHINLPAFICVATHCFCH